MTSQDFEKHNIDSVVKSVQRYIDTEWEQEIGDLKARLLVDFILKEVAPFAYNKGIQDAQRFILQHVEDMPGTCFQPELTYWKK